MVKHIVIYTLQEGCDKSEAVSFIADCLEPLVGKIPGLQHMEVRRTCLGDMDYVLYSEFESVQALQAYQGHPLHLEAKDKFHHLIATRVCGDYEI
jgi:quinol monooxygenase YgiN